MREPDTNNLTNAKAVSAASERDLRRVSVAIHWIALATFAVALELFCIISASAEDLIGRVGRVADGDTLTIRTAQLLDYRIRIAGIDAPEKGQPFSNRSKQNLARLALNKRAQLDCYKTDRYRRRVCRVFVDGQDIGLEQVRVGLAWWYRYFANEQTSVERQIYERAEAEAKSLQLGLWHDRSPMPPWEWRAARRWDPERVSR